MEHHGAVGQTVGAGVLQVEAVGQGVVDLNGTELPAALQGIFDVKFEFWSVKGAFFGQDLVGQVCSLECFFEHLFRLVPLLVGADALWWARGEFDVNAVEGKGVVDLVEQVDESADLILHLFGRTEDVPVVLRKASHAPEHPPPRS